MNGTGSVNLAILTTKNKRAKSTTLSSKVDRHRLIDAKQRKEKDCCDRWNIKLSERYYESN
jgi:hypothetical protein